jgi:GNAT superfamily N-acetyltransferase
VSAFAVRPATRADVPRIFALIQSLARFEKLADRVVGSSEALEEDLFSAPPHAEVLVAARGDELVGFALFFPSYSTFLTKPGLYLEDLYVEEAHRGVGIGRAILARLAKLAVERGCGRFEWSVLDWNEEAIRFYRKLGAAPNEGWTLFRVTGDALLRLSDESR